MSPTQREVKYWLCTWTTFGTWLPGDPRGFQTWRGREYIPPPKRYAKPGELTYDPRPYRNRHEAAKQSLSQPPVELSDEQVRVAADAFAADVDETRMVGAALAIGGAHAHFLAKFGPLPIRPTCGRFKAQATDALHLAGFPHPRVWCRGVHMTSKEQGGQFADAFRYVCNHVREGAIVKVWAPFAGLIERLEPNVRSRIEIHPPPPKPTVHRRFGGDER